MAVYTTKYNPSISLETKSVIIDNLNPHLSGNDTSVYDLGDVVMFFEEEFDEGDKADVKYLQELLNDQRVDCIEF